MNFGWMSGNGLKFFLPRKTFLTLGRIDCCFDDACSKCLTTGHIFQHIVRKWRENHNFFSDLSSSNCSYGQVECNFDNRLKNILDEGQEMFTYCPKKIQNFIFLKTELFSPTCSSAHVECNFDNSWKSFDSRPK